MTVELKYEVIDSFLYEVKKYFKNNWGTSYAVGSIYYFPTNFFCGNNCWQCFKWNVASHKRSADVVAASNLGIGFLLIICSSIKDKVSLRKVLSGELVLMFCFLAVALFNTFNAGSIVDGGPPPPFWIVLIVNPLLCIYGLFNNKN